MKKVEVVLNTSWDKGNEMVYLFIEIENGKHHELSGEEVSKLITYENKKSMMKVEEETKAPKKLKLSKTMEEAYNKLLSADWYYMHNGKSCEYFANEKGFRSIGSEGTGIVEGGFVYSRMSSSTLNALDKRGLIEVTHDGKGNFDAVKVVDMELPERIEKALQVKLENKDAGYDFIGYATSEKAIKHLTDRMNYKDISEIEVTILGEVELTVWDFFKN